MPVAATAKSHCKDADHAQIRGMWTAGSAMELMIAMHTVLVYNAQVNGGIQLLQK
jgi:hypothetical protein